MPEKLGKEYLNRLIQIHQDFSTKLNVSNPPLGFNPINTTSSLEFNSGDKLGFFLVRNGTIDAVRSGTTPIS